MPEQELEFTNECAVRTLYSGVVQCINCKHVVAYYQSYEKPGKLMDLRDCRGVKNFRQSKIKKDTELKAKCANCKKVVGEIRLCEGSFLVDFLQVKKTC